MSSYAWRALGLNYVQYSAVCARVVRQCLKPEFQAEAVKRGTSTMKATDWIEGKPQPRKSEQGGSG